MNSLNLVLLLETKYEILAIMPGRVVHVYRSYAMNMSKFPFILFAVVKKGCIIIIFVRCKIVILSIIFQFYFLTVDALLICCHYLKNNLISLRCFSLGCVLVNICLMGSCFGVRIIYNHLARGKHKLYLCLYGSFKTLSCISISLNGIDSSYNRR